MLELELEGEGLIGLLDIGSGTGTGTGTGLRELSEQKAALERWLSKLKEAALQRWMGFSLDDFESIEVTAEARGWYEQSEYHVSLDCPEYSDFICRVHLLAQQLARERELLVVASTDHLPAIKAALLSLLERPALGAWGAVHRALEVSKRKLAEAVWSQLQLLKSSNSIKKTLLSAYIAMLQHEALFHNNPLQVIDRPIRSREEALALLEFSNFDRDAIETHFLTPRENRLHPVWANIHRAIAILVGSDWVDEFERLERATTKLKAISDSTGSSPSPSSRQIARALLRPIASIR